MADTDLHSILWRAALDKYAQGDPRELARLIRERTPAPGDAAIGDAVCRLAADLIEGRQQAPRKRGPLPRLSVPQLFRLRVADDELRRDGLPESVRIDRLAEQFSLSPSAARALLRRPRASKVST